MEELAESAQQEPAREDECNSLACRLHAHQVPGIRTLNPRGRAVFYWGVRFLGGASRCKKVGF